MGLVLFLFFISCVFTLFLVSYDIQRAYWKCSGISQQLSLTHWIAPSVLCCWGWTLTPTYISNCYESDVASLFCTLNISSVKLWYIPFSTEQSCQWWFGFVFFYSGSLKCTFHTTWSKRNLCASLNLQYTCYACSLSRLSLCWLFLFFLLCPPLSQGLR